MQIFGNDIRMYIPLSNYTEDEWYEKVEDVRATKNTPEEACCTCCTPTAEAFDHALEQFQLYGQNPLKTAFVITDGVPSNNDIGSPGGRPEWSCEFQIWGILIATHV